MLSDGPPPKQFGGIGLCYMPLSLGPASAFAFYLLFFYAHAQTYSFMAHILAHTLAFYLPWEVQVLKGLVISPVLI